MTTYTKTQNKQQQQKMLRYVWFLLSAIGIVLVWGIITLYSSVTLAYQAEQMESENEQIAEEIAKLESSYRQETQKYQNKLDQRSQEMVVYSPKDSHVRYARVGGSVYSMLQGRTF